MKIFFLLTSILLSLAACAQEEKKETFDWDLEAQTNIRLLPKYGMKPKTEAQKEVDERFINSTLNSEKINGDKLKASNQHIGFGFQYLYKGDIKTAMYRFNQAYLLDNDNPEIYWGFGAVYMTLGKFEEAKTQYQIGLAVAPNNTHLLTDLGTYYQAMYHINEPINEANAKAFLDTAIAKLSQSYQLDKNDPNTSFKLSVAYFYSNNCKEANKYLAICDALDGRTITEEYRAALKQKCQSSTK